MYRGGVRTGSNDCFNRDWDHGSILKSQTLKAFTHLFEANQLPWLKFVESKLEKLLQYPSLFGRLKLHLNQSILWNLTEMLSLPLQTMGIDISELIYAPLRNERRQPCFLILRISWWKIMPIILSVRRFKKSQAGFSGSFDESFISASSILTNESFCSSFAEELSEAANCNSCRLWCLKIYAEGIAESLVGNLPPRSRQNAEITRFS